MIVLAIGDLHGSFPERLKRIARKADLILCTGDYSNSDKIRKIIFKNWVNKEWYEAIGINKAIKFEKESFDSGLKVMKDMNKIGKPVYSVWGNSDFNKEARNSGIFQDKYEDRINKFKNFKIIHKKKVNIFGMNILGYGGYLDVTDFIKHPISKNPKDVKRRLKRYNKSREKLLKFIGKYNPRDFIFLIHYPPYKCMDKINYPGSPMNGRFGGFQPYNEVIKKYKPALVICGHIHENQGVCKMGKTIIVNTGSAREGKAALIEIENKRIKSVRLIK